MPDFLFSVAICVQYIFVLDVVDIYLVSVLVLISWSAEFYKAGPKVTVTAFSILLKRKHYHCAPFDLIF